MAKIKVNRAFKFKAYCVDKDVELDNNRHSGEFVFKSECHYYVEKNILDMIKTNVEKYSDYKYVIYKISSKEDSDIADKLVEIISVKNGEINID